MPANPLHTSTKTGAILTAPPGGFAMNPVKDWEGCSACFGRTLIEVTNDSKRVVGYLESEYLWSFGVPDDPSDHPASPHYVMEWLALGPDMEPLEDIDTSKSLHFAASELLRRAEGRERQGDTEAPDPNAS